MASTDTYFVWTGDYAERLNRLYAAVELAAKDQGTASYLNEPDPFDKLSEEYAELLAEAQEAGHRIILRGLNDLEWDDFVEKYPPRTEPEDVAEADKLLGFNEKAGMRPLIYAALVEPKFDSLDDFNKWTIDIGVTRGDIFGTKGMGMKAWVQTNGSGVDPKSLRPLPTRTAEQG